MDERTDALSGGHASTDAIRRDIAHTQREMSETIDEIQHRLSPAYMKQRAKESIRRTSVNTSRGLMDKVRENPLGAAMVGVGLWMMFRDSSSNGRSDAYVEFEPYEDWDRQQRGYSSAAEYRDFDYGSDRGRAAQLKDRVSEAGERVSHAMHETRERVSESMHDASRYAHEMGERARWRAMRARAGSRDMMNETPLIAGVAALAVGAILGAMIPETDREHELFGEKRDELLDRGKALARQGLDKAGEVAGAAARAATDTAKEEMKTGI